MDMHDQTTEQWQGTDGTDITQKLGQRFGQQPILPSPTLPRSEKKISRRTFFGATAIGLGVAAVAGGGVLAEQALQHGGLNSLFHKPITSSMQIGHLLRRAGFGATPDDLNTYGNLDYASAVDHLINYQQVSDDAMEARLKSLNLDFSALKGAAIVNMQRWWLLRMAWTQRPLLEKMTLFWHGFLTSSYHKVGGPNAYQRMMVQNQFFRAHAFDSFDNILLGITSDPAMLVYLDLTKSHKNAPNENYARELMELFTLGLGNYTQQDVFMGAAALTGWHVDGHSLQGNYVERDHNSLTKTYLGQTGNLDYKDVIRILANHPATPKFLAHKLFTFFAYENPSDSDVQPLVDAYNQNGHSIGAMMKTLLLSPQFTSDKAYRARIKSPSEFVAGTYRALNIQGNGAGLENMTIIMGQTLFDPPNVAGWPADKVSALWLNSGTWMSRLNTIDQLVTGGRGQLAKGKNTADLQGLINANKIDTPDTFVNFFTGLLLDGQIDAGRHSQFVNYFNQPNASRSTDQITLTNGKSYPLNTVRGTLYLILASPEYQLN